MTALLLSGTLTAGAENAFHSYNYTWWGNPLESQSGYVASRTITGASLELDALDTSENGKNTAAFSEPSDMFIFRPTGEMFIADSGNNRIVIADVQNLTAAARFDARTGEMSPDEELNLANITQSLIDGEGLLSGASSAGRSGEVLPESESVDIVQSVLNKTFKNKEVNIISHTKEPFDSTVRTGTFVLNDFVYGEGYRHGTEEGTKVGEHTSLSQPTGVFCARDMSQADGMTLYIADKNNERVIACDRNGVISAEYVRPPEEYLPSDITFAPDKVLVDDARNVYIVIKSVTQGAFQFDSSGTFLGFFGANRVQQTGEAVLNSFLKFILTREQMALRTRAVPIEFSNLDIDSDGFIYTVTDSPSATTDVLKRMNPAGQNVMSLMGFDGKVWGDAYSVYTNGVEYKTALTDVDIGEDGCIYLLDFTMGRVFQYDSDGNLLFTFGGSGSQKGLFISPAAVETYDDSVFVMDNRKNCITVFRRTDFGRLVIAAASLWDSGKYEESKELWLEILSRDANYGLAYVGLGNSYLQEENFDIAMNYFLNHSVSGYDRAFHEYRTQVIRRNFNIILAVIIIVVAGLLVYEKILKERTKKKNTHMVQNDILSIEEIIARRRARL